MKIYNKKNTLMIRDDYFNDFNYMYMYICILSFAELNTASHSRNLQDLDKAIARAKAANYDSLLDLQIVMAGRLRDQLHRIEKLRHSVLNMDNRTISEIRTYGNPPDGVHQSLQAAFLLLGNSKKDVKVGTSIIHLYMYKYIKINYLYIVKVKCYVLTLFVFSSKYQIWFYNFYWFTGMENVPEHPWKNRSGFSHA